MHVHFNCRHIIYLKVLSVVKLNLLPFVQRIQFLLADPSSTFYLTDLHIIKFRHYNVS